MRPPCCGLCGRDMDEHDQGGLVSFALRPEDEAWKARAEAEQLVGHPPWMEWFCGEHLAAARALAHLTRPQAMARLREGLRGKAP